MKAQSVGNGAPHRIPRAGELVAGTCRRSSDALERLPLLRQAVAKAESAYGGAVLRNLVRALERVLPR